MTTKPKKTDKPVAEVEVSARVHQPLKIQPGFAKPKVHVMTKNADFSLQYCNFRPSRSTNGTDRR
jgi:hypothetical protein